MIGIVAEPYHIVPVTTKTTKKTTAILLEIAVSILSYLILCIEVDPS